MDQFLFKQSLTLLFSGAMIVVLFYLSLRITEKDDDKWVNLAVVVFGLTAGWLLGIFISPYDGEANHFREIGATVTAFFSGYVLSKIDGTITRLLSAEHVLKGLSGFRIMAGLTALMLALILTYVGRTYIAAPDSTIGAKPAVSNVFTPSGANQESTTSLNQMASSGRKPPLRPATDGRE